jgi:hypothetical protein
MLVLGLNIKASLRTLISFFSIRLLEGLKSLFFLRSQSTRIDYGSCFVSQGYNYFGETMCKLANTSFVLPGLPSHESCRWCIDRLQSPQVRSDNLIMFSLPSNWPHSTALDNSVDKGKRQPNISDPDSTRNHTYANNPHFSQHRNFLVFQFLEALQASQGK